MISILQIAFWSSIFLIFFSYIIYPLVLKFLKVFVQKQRLVYDDTDSLPGIVIIMAVFNEEKVIGAKLDSILKSEYPKEKISILIGSDQSTDKSDEIIQEFVLRDSRIKLIRFNERSGKTKTINKLVDSFEPTDESDEILIFTDANVMLDRTTILDLVKYFKDSRIAQVGAQVINKGMRMEGISYQEHFYISRENQIKYLEGELFGTMMGAFGACFAHRANLIEPIPSNHVVDDFYLTMKMLEKGYDCIMSNEAVCYEDLPDNIWVEYRRKKRISMGNYQNLFAFWKSLIPTRPGLSFSFLSHKVLRWLTPLFIIMAYLASIFLMTNSGFFRMVFLMMSLSFLLPFFDNFLQRHKVHIPILRYIRYFYFMNVALLEGFIDYLKGRNRTIWQPTTRTHQNSGQK